jgi:hypothetical protein
MSADAVESEALYRLIPLSQVKIGMTLGQNVLDKEGRVIIAQSTRLTPMLLSRLAKWNIMEIYVPKEEIDGGSPRMAELPKPALRQTAILANLNLSGEEKLSLIGKIADEMDNRFFNVKDQPLMSDLRDAAEKWLLIKRAANIPGRK